MVKNPPAKAGDARDAGSSPGSGRSPGEGNATHSSILAWRIPWTNGPGGLQSMGRLSTVRRESDTTESLNIHTTGLRSQRNLCGAFYSNSGTWLWKLKTKSLSGSLPLVGKAARSVGTVDYIKWECPKGSFEDLQIKPSIWWHWFFEPHCMVCKISVPQPRIGSWALGSESSES